MSDRLPDDGQPDADVSLTRLGPPVVESRHSSLRFTRERNRGHIVMALIALLAIDTIGVLVMVAVGAITTEDGLKLINAVTPPVTGGLVVAIGFFFHNRPDTPA